MSSSPSAPPEDMTTRAQTLAANLHSVITRIASTSNTTHPRLVAVSKLHPASDILALYTATSHTHMGENYVQELLEKSRTLPREIDWHFIGQLQTNKCRVLAEKVVNLWAVESLDNKKKADALDKGRAVLISGNGGNLGRLRVYVQVNTSGEESKSGCDPADAPSLARHIVDTCQNLKLQGLMTIGAIARSKASEVPNEDFILLRDTRDSVAEAVGVEPESLELSMGMSEDFEQAVKLGSTNVRVGTTIFGQRPPKKQIP